MFTTLRAPADKRRAGRWSRLGWMASFEEIMARAPFAPSAVKALRWSEAQSGFSCFKERRQISMYNAGAAVTCSPLQQLLSDTVCSTQDTASLPHGLTRRPAARQTPPYTASIISGLHRIPPTGNPGGLCRDVLATTPNGFLTKFKHAVLHAYYYDFHPRKSFLGGQVSCLTFCPVNRSGPIHCIRVDPQWLS